MVGTIGSSSSTCPGGRTRMGQCSVCNGTAHSALTRQTYTADKARCSGVGPGHPWWSLRAPGENWWLA